MTGKKISIPIVLLFICGLLASCAAGKDSKPGTSFTQLHFGNGGGFTGAVNRYVLHPDGRLMKAAGLSDEFKELARVNTKQTDKLFQEARQLGLDTIQFNHPGNLYYFIEVQKAQSTPRITWGSADHAVPTQVQEFYNRLIQTIPN